MFFINKKNKKCIAEAIKHLELNLIDRKEKNIRFREVNSALDVKEGTELLLEYENYFHNGDMNHLVIPLKTIKLKNEEELVNYFYNTVYFGIYKKVEKYKKVNIYYQTVKTLTKKNHYSVIFLIVLNDNEVYLLNDEKNKYFTLEKF